MYRTSATTFTCDGTFPASLPEVGISIQQKFKIVGYTPTWRDVVHARYCVLWVDIHLIHKLKLYVAIVNCIPFWFFEIWYMPAHGYVRKGTTYF